LRSLVVTVGLHKKETEIRPIVMIANKLSREGCYFRLQIADHAEILTISRLTARPARGDASQSEAPLDCGQPSAVSG
jgi:hypothetical protein